MTVTIADPTITIKNLIKNNWTVGNTVLDQAPQIHTGWYEENQNEVQVTITSPDESTRGGGQTGFIGIAQAGAPAQIRGGIVSVDIWAHRNMVMDAGADIPNPKNVVWDLSNEVMRIITANYEVADHLWVSFGFRRKLTDSTMKPVLHRIAIAVSYGWLKTVT